ncbi:MAG: MBL fold metallo-hydrolase [Candidatus Hermodarchaeia archaeon]|jgi:glyoxylase-like metal-dependent hydrolase (beta-lactamase superfamily II)
MGKGIEQILENAEVIDVDDDWFLVKVLPYAVYAIQEPNHWQNVISFLILGEERAALFDTGMGIRDISKVVAKLTNLDVFVVNSHTHFDHVGDNFRFDEIHVFDHPVALKWLTDGQTSDLLRFDSRPDAFPGGYPEGFDPDRYVIRPVSAEVLNLLHDGDLIDLGNRMLEVIHTPGHSPDSIMLLDRVNRSLFTGDTFYPDFLFAFIDDERGGSNLQIYEETMIEITKLVPELDYVYCSHTKPLVDPEILQKAADAFGMIRRGEVEYVSQEMYGLNLRLHTFNGFSILTKDD